MRPGDRVTVRFDWEFVQGTVADVDHSSIWVVLDGEDDPAPYSEEDVRLVDDGEWENYA